MLGKSSDHGRLVQHVMGENPLRLPESGLAAVKESAELLEGLLSSALGDLETMNTSPCGLLHHQAWTNGGRVGEVCSDILRANSLHCAHSSRTPMRNTIDMLHAIEFITEGERDQLVAVNRGTLLDRVDKIANVLEYCLLVDPAEREEQNYGKKLAELGLDVDVTTITTEQVPLINMRLQAQAGEEVRRVHKLLVSSLTVAQAAGESFEDKQAAFRAHFAKETEDETSASSAA